MMTVDELYTSQEMGMELFETFGAVPSYANGFARPASLAQANGRVPICDIGGEEVLRTGDGTSE